MPDLELDHKKFQAGLLALVLLIAGLAYSPGSGGGLHFDDLPNLDGLAAIHDWRDALIFTLSGDAGPLGRPIALASFLPHSAGWPDNIDAMLRVNIVIHLFNGLLVAWLALRLGMMQNLSRAKAGYLAILTCAMWTLMPLLASSSLLIIQRMNTLSACFVLLGLIGFLHFRHFLEQSPRRALAGMTASILIFTALATLSKENGALLPLFALITSLTLLPPPPDSVKRAWQLWSFALLWLPASTLIVVLATLIPYPETTAFLRDFTAWERLITQTGILWQYLFHAFIPTETSFFGPFHEDYKPARSLLEPFTLLATMAWGAVVLLTLHLRRAAPIFAFAVFWYLGGHVIESTVLPLELYFEHRNYMPIIGPVFALVWLVVHVPERYQRAAIAGATVYSGLLALTLWIITSQWGSPLRAAEQMYRDNPESPRAAGHYSAHLAAIGAIEPVFRLLDRAIENEIHPERLMATKIYFSCRYRPEENAEQSVHALIKRLPDAGPDRNLASTLHGLIKAAEEHDCRAISPQRGTEIIEALASHPMYDYEGSFWYYLSRAQLAHWSSDANAYRHYMVLAIQKKFDPGVLNSLIELNMETGVVQSCELMNNLWQHAPFNPTKYLGRRLLLKKFVDEINETANHYQCKL